MATAVLRWNPAISNVKESDFIHWRDEGALGNWSMWDYERAEEGDRFVMLRVGDGPTGVVMTGVLASDAYPAPDWSGKGRNTHYCDLFPHLVPPADRPLIPMAELVAAIPDVEWNAGHSGVYLNDEQETKLWKLLKTRILTRREELAVGGGLQTSYLLDYAGIYPVPQFRRDIMPYACRYRSPYGPLMIVISCGYVVMCDWEHSKRFCRHVDSLSDSVWEGMYLDDEIDKEELRHDFIAATDNPPDASALDATAPRLLHETVRQLDAYFAGRRKTFRLPLYAGLHSTFADTVLEELRLVPYGQRVTYGQIATRASRPKAVRPAAAAIADNILSILIPCHRVIGAGGRLTGYAGGIDAKRRLLALEAK